MAEDLKYGKVTTEHGTLGEHEPVVVFRARDALLLEVLDFYLARCKAKESPPHHLSAIEESKSLVEVWQADYVDQVRIPRSDSYAERIGET